MKPVLHEYDTTDFTGLGLGTLADATECTVKEELGGVYELSIQYPVNGIHADLIRVDRIITAPPDDQTERQPFRIYRVAPSLNGTMAVRAEHISYQLNHIPVKPFSASSLRSAVHMSVLLAGEDCPFLIGTDVSSDNPFVLVKPTMLRSVLAGPSDSIAAAYGLEAIWDNWTVRLVTARGADKGVTVRYGKNMTDLEHITDISGLVTSIYPYWQKDGVTVTGNAAYWADSSYSYWRSKIVDMTAKFDAQPSQDDLHNEAEAELLDRTVNALVSTSLGFVPMWQTEEYKNMVMLDRVQLGDTISVSCPPLGIYDAKARVVSTTFDVLLNRYKDIQVGTLRPGLGRTLANIIRRVDLA